MLKEFMKLNVNLYTTIKSVKHAEFNANVASYFLTEGL